MSDQDRTEPRVWAMPEEPPVGTVVWNPEMDAEEGADGPGLRRYRRAENGAWLELDQAGEEIEHGYSWLEVLQDLCGGRVVEVLPTPAEALAERLLRLARHLRAHPDLASVDTGRSSLKLRYDATARELLDWAMSIGATCARLTYPQHEASSEVAAEGNVDGCPESVSCYLDEFRSWLEGRTGIPEDGAFSLDLLLEFAVRPTTESGPGA